MRIDTASSATWATNVTPLREHVLEIVTATPGLDDIEIADRLGVAAFRVSEVLHALRDEGLVK